MRRAFEASCSLEEPGLDFKADRTEMPPYTLYLGPSSNIFVDSLAKKKLPTCNDLDPCADEGDGFGEGLREGLPAAMSAASSVCSKTCGLRKPIGDAKPCAFTGVLVGDVSANAPNSAFSFITSLSIGSFMELVKSLRGVLEEVVDSADAVLDKF
jgi:hypothetical protein